MKRIVKRGLLLLIRLWSKIYSYKISLRIQGYRDSLYTMWICNFLGKIGNNSLISYPCYLQGGGYKSISIGDYTSIQSHGIIGCWKNYQEQKFTPEIVIGDNCNIGEWNQITAINKITIGNGLLTGRYVYIGDNTHGGLSLEEALTPPARRNLVSKGEIHIGSNVWLGDKVSILGGVNIGDNVIIGAGSIVTHDIPANCLAVGIPAKVIKRL